MVSTASLSRAPATAHPFGPAVENEDSVACSGFSWMLKAWPQRNDDNNGWIIVIAADHATNVSCYRVGLEFQEDGDGGASPHFSPFPNRSM